MNFSELVEFHAGNTSNTKVAARSEIESVVVTLASALEQGTEITLPGFGKLKIKTTTARSGRNPKTGETITIPSKKKVVFVEATQLKGLINPT